MASLPATISQDSCVLIEDNGTYGLTKGQFSATADLGSVQKKGAVNTFQPIDPCAVAACSEPRS